MQQKNYRNAWRTGNDRGEGFDFAEASGLPMVLVQQGRTNEDVDVYREPEGSLILVGDCYGPWAVRIHPEDIQAFE